MNRLNLKMVPAHMRDEVEKQFAAGNAALMLVTMPNTECLEFVAHNAGALTLRGIYERAVVIAFSDTRTNFAEYPAATVRYVFDMADRRKLLAAGDPLPPGDMYTVYRGVAGTGCQRRLAGPSWTGDAERAKWYARRSALASLENPAVLVASVPRREVYYYTNRRDEREFVVFVDSPKRLDIDLGDPRREAEEEEEAEEAAAKAAKA